MCCNNTEYPHKEAAAHVCVHVYGHVYCKYSRMAESLEIPFSFSFFYLPLFIRLDCVYPTAELLFKYLLSSYAPINNCTQTPLLPQFAPRPPVILFLI